MTRYTEDRTFEQQACVAFVVLSVVIGVIGFWQKGWLPGSLLTVAMGVTVFLLSRAVGRVQEAIDTGNYVTAVLAFILGVGFTAIEANLNHIGIAHLNAEYDLAPEAYIWPACWFISIVNVFATFAFARTLIDRKARKSPGQVLAIEGWKKRKAA